MRALFRAQTEIDFDSLWLVVFPSKRTLPAFFYFHQQAF